jgi:hypothetical protein
MDTRCRGDIPNAPLRKAVLEAVANGDILSDIARRAGMTRKPTPGYKPHWRARADVSSLQRAIGLKPNSKRFSSGLYSYYQRNITIAKAEKIARVIEADFVEIGL